MAFHYFCQIWKYWQSKCHSQTHIPNQKGWCDLHWNLQKFVEKK